MLAFFGFYIAVSFLISGLVAGPLIREFFPDRDVLGMAGAFLIYYLPVDILTRYFLQKFPTLAIKPYLLLPVSKSAIVHYLLRRSLFSFFSLLPLFLAVPFFFAEVLPNASGTEAAGFLLLVFGLILIANYASFWVTKASDFNNIASVVLLLLLFAFLFFEFRGITSFSTYLETAALAFIGQPIWWTLPFIVSGGIYFYLHGYFKKHLKVKKEIKEGAYLQNIQIGFFSRFGRAGKLMDLELKLLIRSKRARAYLLTSLILLFLPLILTFSEEGTDFNYILFGIFMTGMIALNHGQLMLSWNSLHFDLLMSRGNTIHDIFKAKYYILALSCLVTYALTLPYLFFDPKIVAFNTALVFINTSFSIYAYMVLASYNSLRVDPNEGGAFSFGGFGAAHYLIGIPIIVVPALLYGAGYVAGGTAGGLITLFTIGVIGTAFHKQVISACVKLFTNNRYKILAAFRKE
jgi:hypothetical protein